MSKKQIELIEEKCKENGLAIKKVFREANVPESTIANWRKKEPGAFETLRKINNTIEDMVKRPF